MGKFALKKYQKTSAYNCHQALSRLFAQSDRDRLAAVAAGDVDKSNFTKLQLVMDPGMGKTVILAALISGDTSLYADKGDPINTSIDLKKCLVLWVTPGRGDLAAQSHARLKEFLGPQRDVLLVGRDTNLPTSNVAGTVVVANYESLVQQTTDPDTKEKVWKNTVMRDGENATYFNMCEAAKREGERVLVVIDEAHIGSRTGRSAIRRFFDALTDVLGHAPTRFEVTATPQLGGSAQGSSHFIEERVDRWKGVEEGLLRDNLMVNPLRAKLGADAVDSVNARMRAADGSDRFDNGDPPEYLVITEIAARLRNDLSVQANAQSNRAQQYNPLIVITLNDAPKGGNDEKDVVLEYLYKRGFSKEDVLVWLSEESLTNKVKRALSDASSPVKVIISKTAISVGWDCPRAQILVSIRDSSTMKDSFSIQLLGRIQRQPYGARKEVVNTVWGTDVLNTAYAFTACEEGFLARGDKSGDGVHDSDESPNVDADEEAYALWKNSGAIRWIPTRVNRTPSRATDYASINEIDVSRISDTGDHLKSKVISDYLVAGGVVHDIHLVSDREGGALSDGAAKKLAVPSLGAWLRNYDTNNELRLHSRHAMSAIGVVIERITASVNAYPTDTPPNPYKVLLAACSQEDGGDLSAVLQEVFRIAKAKEIGQQNGWEPSKPMPYIPPLFRKGGTVYSDGVYTNTALSTTHLYGESKFRDSHGSPNEDAFESEVLGTLLKGTVVSWLRSSKDIDGDSNSASLTFTDANGHERAMFPDYAALLPLANDAGKHMCVLFEVKGSGGSDGSSGDLVQRKATALHNLGKASGGTMAGAVVYRSGRNWVVLADEGKVTPLAEWLKRQGVDL